MSGIPSNRYFLYLNISYYRRKFIILCDINIDRGKPSHEILIASTYRISHYSCILF